MAAGRSAEGRDGGPFAGARAVRAGRFNALTDVAGLEVGHCTLDTAPALTGVTVVLARHGAVAAVDVRGAAPATRETDALRLENLVGEVQAVVLAGSSAYGLSAADGVMAYLEELGLGVRVGAGDNHVVPVVPAAAVFDLGRGGDFSARADAASGRRAAAAAAGGALAEGNVGAGAGAAFAGRSLKGGIGTSSASGGAGGGATVGALVVLNALGSAVDPASGMLYGAGSLLDGEAEAIGLRGAPSCAELGAWRARAGSGRAGAGGSGGAGAGPAGPLAGQQTVIGVVATDADLSRAETQRLARIAHDGLARAVRPAHTSFDGDAFFALATQQRPLVLSDTGGRQATGGWQGGKPGAAEALSARAASLVELFELAADCVTRAIVHSVVASRSAAGISCYADVFPSAAGR